MTGEVVYYIRREGLIKIGWTRNLAARMRRLRPDELLAVEPGNLPLETGRHRQFAAHRAAHAGGREWYLPSPELLDHITRLTSIYDLPSLPACRRRSNTAVLRKSNDRRGTKRDLPALMPPSNAELADLRLVKGLEGIDLSSLDDARLVEALHAADRVIAAAPRRAGYLVNVLRRRGMSWSQLSAATGVPQTVLHNRLFPRPSLKAGS